MVYASGSAGADAEPAADETRRCFPEKSPCLRERPSALAARERTGPFTPDRAFDGIDTAWNSGKYPVGWIEVNFDTPLAFSKMSAWVAQTPAGNTTHDVTLDGARVQLDR